MEENIEIDEKELQKQYREDILNSGNYARLEIIIEAGSKLAIPIVELKGIGPVELAALTKTAEETINQIREEFPEIIEIEENMGLSTIERLSTINEEETNGEKEEREKTEK